MGGRGREGGGEEGRKERVKEGEGDVPSFLRH